MTKVLIIGAGEIGKALAHLLTKSGHTRVSLYDKDLAKMRKKVSLANAVPVSDFVFLCIPSWALRSALVELKPLLRPRTLIVSIAKGLEKGTGKTSDQILRAMLPRRQPFALISGPMLAEELMQDKNAAAMCGANAPAARTRLLRLFAGTTLRLEPVDNLRALALAGVLKNVYAFTLGIADGLRWSANAKGWLVSRAISEMSEMLRILAHDDGTLAFGAAGIGDLITTGYSRYSRNRRTGELIGKGRRAPESEGMRSLQAVAKLLGSRAVRFPVLSVLRRIVEKRESPARLFQKLISPQMDKSGSSIV